MDWKKIDRRTAISGASAAVIMAMLKGADAATRVPGALDASGKFAFAGNQSITPLIPDKLYRVGCVVHAERLSWLPADTAAFEPINLYLLVDGGNCVFMEMGPPVALPALKLAIETVVGDRKVWAAFSRNEADCIGNMGYILGTCREPTLLFGGAGGILEWINDPSVSMLEVRDFLGRIPIVTSKNGESRTIGSFDLSWFDAPLKQMLMTQWAFERNTGCLFTSESFGFRHMETIDSAPVIENTKNLPKAADVAREIVARVNWLREADYPEVAENIEKVFKTHDVQIIAPVHGCALKGRSVIAAHVKVAIDALNIARTIPDFEVASYV